MSPVRMSKVEASTRVVLAYKDAFNNHNVDAIVAMLSDDCVFEPVQDNLRVQGIEAIHAHLQEAFKGTEQAQIKVEAVFGVGLHVILQWQMDGQHGVDIFKFREGMICEKTSYVKR